MVLSPGEKVGRWTPFSVKFDVDIWDGHDEETLALGDVLGEPCTPIADIGRGNCVLMCCGDFHHILVGFAEPGVLYAGNCIEEALTRVCHGLETPILVPDPGHPLFDYDGPVTDSIKFTSGDFGSAKIETKKAQAASSNH
jgi:hypothetical protein